MERIPVLVKPFSDIVPEAEVNLPARELAEEYLDNWPAASLRVCPICGGNLFYIIESFGEDGLEIDFYCAVCGRFVMGRIDRDVKPENFVPKRRRRRKKSE